jgi:hypothetical protein
MHFTIPISALALAGLTHALPAQTRSGNDTMDICNADRYVNYTGNGHDGWPSQANWFSFDQLWAANLPLMQEACGWNGWGAENSATEINYIKEAINEVTNCTGVDRRYMLAIVMQESKGCVRAPTTSNGIPNPGLMQSHRGSISCDGVNPCPKDRIVQMIRDGTAGTAHGDGLMQTLAKTKNATSDDGARSYYAAARMYNSGSVDYNDLNNAFGSTICYATDIANRLTGWTRAASACE